MKVGIGIEVGIGMEVGVVMTIAIAVGMKISNARASQSAIKHHFPYAQSPMSNHQ
jgi:hypothetical protein